MKHIAIQGAKGSFHDIAAHRYFGGEEIEVIYCATFEDIFSAIKKDDSVIGLMAIEKHHRRQPAAKPRTAARERHANS